MESKKKIIIIVVVILAITTCLAIYLNSLNQNNDSNENNPNIDTPSISNPNTDKDITISKNIELLTDEKMFFNLESTVNSFYINVSNNNYDLIYNILDDEYKIINDINQNNISDKLSYDYEMPTYKVKKVYYNPKSDITYYFINGYLYNDVEYGDNSYTDNLNFLIIIKNNYYVIRPLQSNIDIKNYAENFDIKDIDINSKERINNVTISEKNKLISYIGEFLNLLYMDNYKAYDLLNANVRNRYSSYEEFSLMKNEIFNSISTNIFSFGKDSSDEVTIYTIYDKNQKKIVIYEYNIMDYKIEY